MRRSKRLNMRIIPVETEKADEARPAFDIMDAQDNRARGDGDIPKVMTTFKMEAELKAELNAYCRERGLRIGDWINGAVRERLDRERRGL
ncbi:hypothetical protein Uis1B_2276 [Bifidobacterium margollesii]|uniref:Uncharacterized protein n=1 Tax=Bifidobacterium margollesii TaxID=2020964 RepID=A0A2N5J6R2_9BIFI|nr:hypothetical protein [Bifidobacterium margollesii]PLS29895.1 hypothetical protein Uis1B_2276 [Bifidobacterium margollesii]